MTRSLRFHRSNDANEGARQDIHAFNGSNIVNDRGGGRRGGITSHIVRLQSWT
jgi:hypothetical protein